MPEITIPPGVVKTLSEATAVGRFIDMDKVRFYNNKPQKIGGWSKLNSVALVGVPRSLYAYNQKNRQEIKIAGTESHLYAMTTTNALNDITPYRKTSPKSVALIVETTSGSASVKVTDPAHGAAVGDRIHVVATPPGTTVGGITFSGDYTVTSVINSDTYRVTDDEVASANDVLDNTFGVSYYIEAGPVDATVVSGYGSGLYGTGLYGQSGSTDVSGITLKPPRFWSLDNYGTNGLFTYQGAPGIFMWDEVVSPARPTILGGSAPAVNEAIIYAFVTPERFIFTLCEGMVLKWPDRDVPTDWTPTDTNTANRRVLASGAHLIAGCRLANMSLIWTDTSVYSAHYIGGLPVYDTTLIGTNCGLVGPGAFCHETGTAYWFGCGSFHMYSGQIGPIPNQDNVLAWIQDNVTPEHRMKTTCWYNPMYREVWWTFPGQGASEPNLYVAVCLDNYEWIHGTLDRCGAAQQSQRNRLPILASPDGFIYEHDQQQRNADGAPMDWHYQVGLWRIPSDRKQSVDIWGFAPDFEAQVGDIQLQVTAQDRPQSELFDTENKVLGPTTELADLRVAGRYFSYRLSQSNVMNGDFRDGTHWLEVQGAGLRR